MKRLILALTLMGMMAPLSAQEVQTEELTEVVVSPMNYKYLDRVGNKDAAIPVRLLEQEAASYDVLSEGYFMDEYNYYTVSFFIPEGKLVAVYDEEGTIIRTIERFKNVNVPKAVKKSLKTRYPNWEVIKDVYLVTYNEKLGTKKTYKFKLRNGDKVIRVKMDEQGDPL